MAHHHCTLVHLQRLGLHLVTFCTMFFDQFDITPSIPLLDLPHFPRCERVVGAAVRVAEGAAPSDGVRRSLLHLHVILHVTQDN